MGNGEEEQIYMKELEILDKYNRLTGTDLQPLNSPDSDVLQKQAA